MATRNPANEIKFGKVNFGAPITVFAVAGATDVDQQTNPGEDLERFVEVASSKGTIIGLGSESNGAFKKFSIFSSIIFLTDFFILLIEKRDCENIFLYSIRSNPLIIPNL